MRVNWQPIETAPKDGTFILLNGGETQGDDEQPRTAMPAIARWLDKPFPSWFICILEGGYNGVTYIDPTHWASLEDLICE